jgi:hydrogenase maturation protein HypF
MCKSCSSEYSDPTNRRYHTESISCNDCDTTLIGTILECANAIKGGKIVAIKSSGGYHLVCDSGSDSAIMRLREYKRREYKPFAVMIKDISKLDDIADTDEIDKQTLQSLQAPIVIVQKSSTYNLSPLVAPNIDRVGVILPYTPIYHMLYKYIDRPIILTSANIPNEPIIYKDDDVSKLKDIVEYRLSHDIDIQNPTDDSVVQIVDDRLQILRTSRGYAPHVITLDTKSTKRVLALGANQKSTISIAFDRYIITSPYIADLDTIESQDRYKETIDRFIRLYDFVPDVVVCDNHDDYISSKVASEYSDRYDIPLHSIQHHYAHTLSCMSEYRIDTKILAFVFDGNGAGDDGRMWGGEVLIADRYGYERVYHFRYIKLLGISKAIKEPRRVALAILFDTLSLEEIKSLDIPTIDSFSHYEIDMLHKSYIEDISTVDTSSVGRLFDAVSSMCGLSQISSYEAQSGLLVESMYVKSSDEVLEYSIDNGIIDIKIVKYIIKNHDISKLPTLLINTISMIVSDISDRYEYDIVLSGGVWQNKTLMEKTIKSVKNRKIYSNSTTAINDSGISIGQAYWAR